jgi:hypothetical protein
MKRGDCVSKFFAAIREALKPYECDSKAGLLYHSSMILIMARECGLTSHSAICGFVFAVSGGEV